MLDCLTFYRSLQQAGVSFYAGVPDSLLKEICSCITERSAENKHIIAANEGAAVAIATGTYLATGNPGLVYMQNSGLGNGVNPLLSLADAKVYSIPMLLMVGWRGEPGIKDEPQHLKQGEVTLELLDTLGVPYAILPETDSDAQTMVQSMVTMAKEQKKPVALVVRKNTFSRYQLETSPQSHSQLTLTREQALEVVLDETDDVVVATTGMISREIYELREKSGRGHAKDFLTVGSMGHCSQIAMGVALGRPDKKVCCIDGDGALIMHMGSLGVSGQYQGGNLLHIVVNNGKHDSVGGQPTVGFDIDIPAVAKACGYQETISVDSEEGIRREIRRLKGLCVSTLLEIKVLSGARADLGRPTTTPIENKEAFMGTLGGDTPQSDR